MDHDNETPVSKIEELGMDELDAIVGAGPVSDIANSVGKTLGTTAKFAGKIGGKVADTVNNIANDVTSTGESFLDGVQEGFSGENGGEENSGDQK